MTGYVEFEFDLPDALLTSLVDVFARMSAAPLLSANLVVVPEAQGVYQLLLRGTPVYVGKTDAEAGLRRRLERHAKTIQHRRNLDPAEVTFKAVRVFVFTAMDLEAQLIRHYGSAAPLAWNNSGFGSNDPGRRRDHTVQRPEGYDALYPVNVDLPVTISPPAGASAATVLAQLKAALPYLLRVEHAGSGKQPHPELVAASPILPPEPRTARQIIEAVVASLPPGWQATDLGGRVILYRENFDYAFGTAICRS
jgi:hypothetical protein